MSRPAVPFSEENPTAPIDKGQTANAVHIIPPSDITHSEVGSAEDRHQELFPPDGLRHRYLGSGNESELSDFLDNMDSYAEQLETPQADLLHMETLNTVAKVLASVRSFREVSGIVRILRITMRSLHLPHLHKEEACYQFLQNFLEFEDGVEPYQLVARSSSVLPDGLLGGAEESGLPVRKYTLATIVHNLSLILKRAMEKPVINRDNSMMFTTMLCKMMDPLIKQLHDEGGEELGPLGDNHSNETGSKEFQLGTNDLPHELLAFQLQSIIWLHQMMDRDCFNAEHLLVVVVNHLISIAITIATQNQSEKRTQTREYLSIFALGMSTVLPAILDPKHCCWSMPSTCNTVDLFDMCRGRCMRYSKIFKDFECFCDDGLENADFSELGDIRSKLSKNITDFKDWVAGLSSNMKCPEQFWALDPEGWD